MNNFVDYKFDRWEYATAGLCCAADAGVENYLTISPRWSHLMKHAQGSFVFSFVFESPFRLCYMVLSRSW